MFNAIPINLMALLILILINNLKMNKKPNFDSLVAKKIYNLKRN